MLLLNPGPVTLTERVRRSLLQEDLCHRESEFFDVQEEARTRLVGVYDLDPAQWDSNQDESARLRITLDDFMADPAESTANSFGIHYLSGNR